MTPHSPLELARGRARRADPNTLVVTGWLHLADLFPTGPSDADTLPVTFVDARWRGGRVAVVRDFRRWRAIGRVRLPVVDANDRVRVRLLGVDTPELHARPILDGPTARALQAKGVRVPEFRQPGAVRTAARLRAHLARFGERVLVHSVARVAQPTDAIDTYGRLVAWLELPDRSNVNRWLLEEGLGAPALYSGFHPDDFAALVAAAKKGRRKLAARWTTPVGPFPWGVVAKAAPSAREDVGRFVHPKLFRRWAAWAVKRKAGLVRVPFETWLRGGEDRFAELGAGRVVGAFAYSSAELVRVGPGRFSEVVFRAARGQVLRGE